MGKKFQKTKNYQKPDGFAYAIAKAIGFLCSRFLFRLEIERNELKDAGGSFVLIANHECAFDGANTINLTRRRMTYVLSQAFYSTIPLQSVARRMQVIHKQQFQTKPSDLKRMKAVIEAGEGLCLYPAGIMTGDGLSSPIPEGTYGLVKWLGADVYMARTVGSYFVMPKWSEKIHPGKTKLDVFKLFSKEELKTLEKEEIRSRMLEALWFDAYEDQEKHPEKYKNISQVTGLENILYRCPECGKKHAIRAQGKRLSCGLCGFTEEADEYGFLHLVNGKKEYSHVTEWREKIRDLEEEELDSSPYLAFSCRVLSLNEGEHRFLPTDEKGELVLTEKSICLKTEGKEITKDIRIFPTLPFKPGMNVDLQDGPEVKRLLFQDPRLPMEVTDLVELLHCRVKMREWK